MKGYIGTLFQLPQSVEVAHRCAESAKQFGIDTELFPAVWRDVAMKELESEGLSLATYDQSFSNVGSVVGNFVTQYRIWNTIATSNEPGIVLEHDAVFVAEVPDLTKKGDIINLGKPSYGRYQTKNAPGVYPLFSKPGYMPGAHAYYVTPTGADQLIKKAKKLGASPCDIFLNNTNFRHIRELYPWVVEAQDSFTTIQNPKGCTAKHNNGPKFKVIS